jgi:hypothetical protein
MGIKHDHPDITAVLLRHSNLVIISVYNPPDSNDTIHQLDYLLQAEGSPREIIAIGDFNKHHSLWSGEDNPARNQRSDTETLFETMAQHNLEMCTTVGTKTHYSQAHECWTTIDLVIATQDTADAILRCTSNIDDGHGSDHRSIEVIVETQTIRNQPRLRPNYRATEWAKVVEEVQPFLEGLNTTDLSTPEDIDSIADKITDKIEVAVKDHTPIAKPSPYAKRWWTAQLTKLRHDFQKTQRNFNNRPSREAKEKMLEARKTYHKAIKTEKRDHWQQWLEEATEKSVWTAHKYVANVPVDIAATRIPTLTHQGRVAEKNEEKAELLTESFFPPPPTAQLDDIANHE